jgi:galactosylceramidase
MKMKSFCASSSLKSLLVFTTILSTFAQQSPLAPPPGCLFDITNIGNYFFCDGMTLRLETCNATAQNQLFLVGNAGSSFIYHNTSFEDIQIQAIQSFLPNNEDGFLSSLAVSKKVASYSLQEWFEGTRKTTDDTIISNIEDVTQNLTNIFGCLQWTVPLLEVNTSIVPDKCIDGAVNRSWAFDPPNLPGLIMALSDPANATSYTNLCAAVDPSIYVDPFIIDDNAGANFGKIFDGVGITAGEGSTRLLFDYPPQQQQEILDFLFLPGAGANVQILKIEIGGDGNTVQGSTPSHQHYQGEPTNMMRGTQAWLAKQAKNRNPNIIIYAVPWSFPGWLRSETISNKSPFNDPNLAAQYIVDWILGMRDTPSIGVLIDYIGVYSDNWDSKLSTQYVITLKNLLTTNNLVSVQIECADSSTGWQCADEAVDKENPAYNSNLLNAVDIFGGHNLPPVGGSAERSGKRFWQTHVSDQGISDLLGASVTGWEISESYITGNCSAVIVWGALCATYEGMPEFNEGMIRADQPFSGHYFLSPSLIALTHTTAFNLPGWYHLIKGFGSGVLGGSGSFVTRMSPDGSSFSIVISKAANTNKDRNKQLKSELVTFILRGRAKIAAEKIRPFPYLNVYSSNFGATPGGNVSLFQDLGPTYLYQLNGDTVVSVFVPVNSLITLTTDVALLPVFPSTSPPPPTPFAPNYFADFTDTNNGYTPPMTPRYFVEISGAFETIDDAILGRGVQQVATTLPITRFQTDTVPHAILGDQQWSDVSLTISAVLPTPSDSILIGVRLSGIHATENNHISGMDNLPGIWLSYNNSGGWGLFNRLDDKAVTYAQGILPSPPTPMDDISISLVARGQRAIATLNGILLASLDITRFGSPDSGFVGIGATSFSHHPFFRSIKVDSSLSVCNVPPVEGHLLVMEACSVGSLGQTWTFNQQVDSNAGFFQSPYNTSLCLMLNGTADPGFMGDENAKGAYVAVCNMTEPRQYFTIETTVNTTVGVTQLGPITGVNSLTLNVKGDDFSDNSFVCGYEFQGSSNEIFSYISSPAGTIWNAMSGKCISSCETTG